MFLDRLKAVSVDRASRLTGCDSSVIARAMKTYKATNGARGLAFVILPGTTCPRIRLSAIDDWMSQLEEDSRYA